MKVLFTGCAGNIAQRGVYPALKEVGNPWEIVEFDKATTGDYLENLDDLKRKMVGCDVVVHLAAIPGAFLTGNPPDYWRDNVLGTWNVLMAAQECGVSRVVLGSSVAYYGIDTGDNEYEYIDPDYFPVDEDHPTTILREGKLVWEYDTTKVCIESLARWSYWKFDRVLLRYMNPCDTDQDFYNKMGRSADFYDSLRKDLTLIDLEACKAIHSGRATVRATLCDIDEYRGPNGYAVVSVNVGIPKIDEPVAEIISRKWPEIPIRQDPCLNVYSVDRCIELFGDLDSSEF